MDHFPLFANLTDRPCLVVGGGAVAARKVALLHRAGARITVIAPRLEAELGRRAAAGEIDWVEGRFRPDSVTGQRIVIAATDDERVNRRVVEAARAAGAWVNVVDRPELSDFISPALIDRSPLLVAVSTGGAMPVLARRVRAWLEALLPASLGPLAAAADRWRGAVKRALPDIRSRRRFWDRLLDHPPDPAGIETAIRTQLSHAGARLRGKVYLVGAGPGDPELLTLKALQVLQRADVILHDALVPAAILERARRDAEVIDVGKRAGGGHHLDQARINRRLVQLARAGNIVCRLKGGDPAFFSRAGEEIETLSKAGIEVEIVPGVTAASACAAAAGFPLTHRDLSHRVVLATAHCAADTDPDVDSLSRPGQTVALYMPVKKLPELQRRLLARGLAPTTPCAVIENGTLPKQRTLTTTLARLAADARRAEIGSPALLIVGEVVRIGGLMSVYPEETRVSENAA